MAERPSLRPLSELYQYRTEEEVRSVIFHWIHDQINDQKTRSDLLARLRLIGDLKELLSLAEELNIPSSFFSNFFTERLGIIGTEKLEKFVKSNPNITQKNKNEPKS